MPRPFRFIGLAALLVGLASIASAQPAARDDAVMDYYRSYKSALDEGDLAAAETAAVAALNASETRDGDGGHTAVLAENLALVRFERGEAAQALTPAQRALALAQAHADSGVEPLAARLVLGRAEIVTDPPSGRDHLLAALNEANTPGEWDEAAFPAAVALGNWALGAEKYDVANAAWAAAEMHAGASLLDPVLAHAIAKTGQAATLILPHVNRANSESLAQARTLLGDAEDQLYPFAMQERSDHLLTPAQAAYAQAMAWMSFTYVDYERPHARPGADHHRPEVHDSTGAVVCRVRWANPEAAPGLFPAAALAAGVSGVVVVRAQVDANGQILRADAAAAAPPRVFDSAALQMSQHYNVVRYDDAPAGCVMPRVTFQSIKFRAMRR